MKKQEMTNDFMPSDYEVPKASSGYMKFQKGENRFRILSRPIIGWEDWDDKKPIRFKMSEKPVKPIDPKKQIKHFWAFIVWNYAEEKVQILEITQATVQGAIAGFSKDPDWGSPFDYDIKVIKSGDGMETEYTINPVPHKPCAKEITEALVQKGTITLEALFDGGDPFAPVEVRNEPVSDMPF